jgi:hypothetical protein
LGQPIQKISSKSCQVFILTTYPTRKFGLELHKESPLHGLISRTHGSDLLAGLGILLSMMFIRFKHLCPIRKQSNSTIEKKKTTTNHGITSKKKISRYNEIDSIFNKQTIRLKTNYANHKPTAKTGKLGEKENQMLCINKQKKNYMNELIKNNHKENEKRKINKKRERKSESKLGKKRYNQNYCNIFSLLNLYFFYYYIVLGMFDNHC